MLSSLEGYLDFHKEPESPSSPLDHDLVTRIILQSKQVPAWDIDLYPKMQSLVQQFVSRDDFFENVIEPEENFVQRLTLFELLMTDHHLSNEQILTFTGKAIDITKRAIDHLRDPVVLKGLNLIAPLVKEAVLRMVRLSRFSSLPGRR